MRYLSIALLLIPTPAFGAAGFADAYHDHQQWIFPAYFYCLIFGLLLLSGLFIISLICKTKTQEITSAISSYLIRHRILAIIVTGVLLAIPRNNWVCLVGGYLVPIHLTGISIYVGISDESCK